MWEPLRIGIPLTENSRSAFGRYHDEICCICFHWLTLVQMSAVDIRNFFTYRYRGVATPLASIIKFSLNWNQYIKLMCEYISLFGKKALDEDIDYLLFFNKY